MYGYTYQSLLALGALATGSLAQTLDANTIQSMGNNSLFTRWRPTSRFIAPAGWMNDPCGAMYDPTKDQYHLFYQWHPNHINWGNISWGHAVSKDLITWTDVPHEGTPAWQNANALALGPTGNGSYNGLGIFSGTAQPVNFNGSQDGTLLAFYTSVAHLPTSWSAYYIPGTESQSLAYSKDGGLTWQEYAGNPIISTPPPGWNITGWRDPFFEPWPEMDDVLEQEEPHYYAVFGSGIKDVGPRMPFYSAPASDLTKWTFLGALWEPADNTSFGSVLATGTWGFNFEVSGFFSLDDDDNNTHYFAQMGTEGGNVSFHESSHWALYNEGIVSKRANGSVAFEPVSGSAGDWGLLYALTSFVDSKNDDRRVQWGWAPEDIPGTFALLQQGYQGCFALPRALFAHVTKGLVDTDGKLNMSGAYVTKAADGTFTASVLGIQPLDDVVEGIRNGSSYSSYHRAAYNKTTTLANNATMHMELDASFYSVTGQAGLIVAASSDMEEFTTIYYEPTNNTIVVDRSSSTTIANFTTDAVTGFFYPYSTASGVEDINMRVFLDGSLLEVYVNDRFALTTRIYPSREDSTGFGVFLGQGASAMVKDIEAWVGTKNVWPERPLNSSSALVYDTPEETDSYIWWTGN